MTRGIAKDLTGQQFGHLSVQSRNGSDDHGNALWLCKCECGSEVSIRAVFLQKRQLYCSKQCRLYKEWLRDDLSGKRFGRLTAVSLTRRVGGKAGRTFWSLKCECGNVVEVATNLLLSGRTQSCGCLGIESRITHGQSQTREYHRLAYKKWAKENPGAVIANAYQRQQALRNRVPKWLTQEDWERINAVYLEAKRLTEETGIVHEVDHKLPLRGKTLSGLHVPANLQVLTRKANQAKRNHLIDEVC